VPQPPTTNADANWAAFDPEVYFEHYYGEPHGDDELVARKAAAALRAFAGERRNLRVLDVGTGANLIPLLAALPVAQSLTAWEYATSNVAWLEAEFKRASLRPQWQSFWSHVVDVYGAEAAHIDVAQKLRASTSVQQGSVFDLPVAQFDAASMFFCAESITRDPPEFVSACHAFIGAVRSGGALVAAFLARSGGYQVGSIEYPAVPIDEAGVAAIFKPLCRSCRTETIGLSDSQVRSGYSGMVFLVAEAL
jgi:hypothetical protein